MANEFELPKIKQPQADLVLPVPLPPQLPVMVDPTNIQKFVSNKRYWAAVNKARDDYFEEQRIKGQEEYAAYIKERNEESEYNMRHLSDYTSTSEVNSLADVYFNANEQMQGDLKSGNPLDMLFALPSAIIKGATDTADLVNRTTIQPAMDGDWGAVGLNALYNFAETADVLANPVKGAIIGALDTESTIRGNVEAAFGIGTIGRQNFDYDFGYTEDPTNIFGFKGFKRQVPKFTLEVVAEILSDPMTLITFGTTQMAKGAAKRAALEGIEGVTEKAGKEIGSKFAKKIIQGESVDVAAEQVADAMVSKLSHLTTMAKNGGLDINKLVKYYGGDLLQDLTPEVIQKGIMQNNVYSVNRYLQIAKGADAVDSAIIKFAFQAPLGYAPKILSTLVRKSGAGKVGATAFASLMAKTGRVLEPYIRKGTNTINLVKFDSASKELLSQIKVNQLVDFVKDGYQQPAGVLDLMLTDSIRFDTKAITDIITEHSTNSKKFIEELDKFALTSNENFRSFADYIDYINDMTKYTTHAGELNRLSTSLDIVRIQYDMLIESEDAIRRLNGFSNFKTIYDDLDVSVGEKAYLHELVSSKLLPKTAEAVEPWRKEVSKYVQTYLTKTNDELDRLYEEFGVSFTLALDEVGFPMVPGTIADIDMFDTIRDGFITVNKLDNTESWKKANELYQRIAMTEDKISAAYRAESIEDFKGLFAGINNAGVLYNTVEDSIKQFEAVMDSSDMYLDISYLYNLRDKLAKMDPNSTKIGNYVDEINTHVLKAKDDIVVQEARLNMVKESTDDIMKYIDNRDKEVLDTLIKEGVAVFEPAQLNLGTTATKLDGKVGLTFNTKTFELDVLAPLKNLSGKADGPYKDLLEESSKLIGKELSEEAPDNNKILDAMYSISENLEYYQRSIKVGLEKEATTALRDTDLQTIESIAEAFDEIFTITVKEPTLSTAEGIKYYRAKTSQIRNTLALIGTDGVQDMNNSIISQTADSVGAAIHELLESKDSNLPGVTQAAVKLVSNAEGVEQFRTLFNLVMNGSGLDKEVAVAFMDTIQSSAKQSVDKLHTDIDTYVYSFLRRTEDQINTTLGKESLAMDKLRVKFGMKTNLGHDAAQDVLDNIEIANRMLNMDDYIASHENPIWFDIETMGLNKHANPILQIAYQDPITKEMVNLKAKATEFPEESLLRTLAPKNYKTLNERMDWFKAEYMDAPGLMSEKEMLEEFNGYVNRMYNTGQHPVLVGHNINDFDVDALAYRTKHTGASIKQYTVPKVDTLTKMREKEGYFELSPSASAKLRAYLNNYISVRKDAVSDTVFLKYGIDVPKKDFIVTPDKGYSESLMTMAGQMSKMSEELGNLKKTYAKYSEILSDTSHNVRNTLGDIDRLNKDYGNFIIKVDDTYVEKIYEANELTGNLSKMFNEQALRDGKFLHTGYGTITNNDLVRDWFDIPVDITALPVSKASRYSKTARALDDIKVKVDNINYLETMMPGVDEYLANAASKIRSVYNSMSGMKATLTAAQADKVMNIMQSPIFDLNLDKLSNVQRYAVANRIYDKFKALDEELPITLADRKVLPAELKRVLADVKNLSYKNTDKSGIFLDPVLLRDVDFVNGRKMYAENKTIMEGQLNYIEKMDAIIQNHQDFNIISAESRLKVAMLTPIYESFELLQGMSDELKEKLGTGIDYIKAYNTRIVEPLVRYQDYIGVQTVDLFLDQTPEEMVSYLRHKSYGKVVFNTDDLAELTANAAESTKPGVGLDKYLAFNNNREAYEALGIRQYDDGNTVWFYLDKNYDYDNVKFFSDKRDVGHAPSYGTMSEKSQIFKKYSAAKENLDLYSDGASKNTAGETFSASTFNQINEVAPDEVLNNSLEFEYFDVRREFDGINFNRTVLGKADNKKDILPHISKNILKNYSSSTQDMIGRVDAVTKYGSLLFDESSKLDWFATHGYSDSQLFDYLQSHKEYSIGMLVENKKRGVKLSTRKIKTVADVTAAREAGAVMLPEFVSTKAKSIINRGRVSSRLVKLMDKYYIGATKLGYLTSLGFLARNIVDSTLKNAVTADSLDIVPYTLDVWKSYHTYKDVASSIIEKYQRVNTRTINQFFVDNKDVMDQELFELMYTFIKDGPSAGHSSELQKYFDDDAIRLHQRSRLSDVDLTVDDVKEMLTTDRKVWSANKRPEIVAELDRLKLDEVTLEKAKAMAVHAKDVRLNVNTIDLYLKRPDKLPSYLAEEFERLKKYKVESQIEKYMDKALYNPLTQAVTNANGYLEQVFRLTQYMYSIKNGFTIDQAVKRVVDTHFDPTHKTTMERGLEMLFPFSTFTIKNAHYWLDNIHTNGAVGRVLRDWQTPAWDFDNDERDRWDQYNQRSLQYMIFSGNIPVDALVRTPDYVTRDGVVKKNYDGSIRTKPIETLTTLKLSPSVMDTVNMLLDPIGTMQSRLIAPVKAIGEMYIWDDKDFEDVALNLIPFYGVGEQRLSSASKYYGDTGNILNRVLPTLFGRTNIVRQPSEYEGNPNFDEEGRWLGEKKVYGGNVRKYNTTHSTYQGYTTFPEYKAPTYKNVDKLYNEMIYRNGEAKMTRSARNLWYNRTDFHKDLFTAKSKSRLKLSMLPIRPDSVERQIKSQWSMLR